MSFQIILYNSINPYLHTNARIETQFLSCRCSLQIMGCAWCLSTAACTWQGAGPPSLMLGPRHRGMDPACQHGGEEDRVGAVTMLGCVNITGAFSCSKGNYLQSMEKCEPHRDTWDLVRDLPKATLLHGCICVYDGMQCKKAKGEPSSVPVRTIVVPNQGELV